MTFEKELTAEYLPIVLELREILDPIIGPLLWKEPMETRIVTHTERPPFARIGTSFGDGVALKTVDPDEVFRAFNTVARKHGFSQAPRVEWVDGGISLTADNGIGTTIETRVGQNLRIWVDSQELN